MARRLFVLLILLLPLVGFTSAPEPEALGRQLGLMDPKAFAATVLHVCRYGRLPDHYLTRSEARALGWRPGEDLCKIAPGRVLGGDRFFNRERLLPEQAGREWFAADLDFACGTRGPRRLVFSNDRLIFVTLDHYRSFVPVPCPNPAGSPASNPPK